MKGSVGCILDRGGIRHCGPVSPCIPRAEDPEVNHYTKSSKGLGGGFFFPLFIYISLIFLLKAGNLKT